MSAMVKYRPPSPTGLLPEVLEALKRPVVLLRDQNHLWCTLSNMYWSSSTRQLLARHPLSTLEEVISIYCPQCLTRYTEDDANEFLGTCPKCKECPCCSSVVTIKNKDIMCSFCLWQKSVESTDSNTVAQQDRDKLAQDAMRALIDSMREKHKSAAAEGLLPRNTHLGEWNLENLRIKMTDHTDDSFAADRRAIQSSSSSSSRGIPYDDEIACQSMEDTLITNVVQRLGNVHLQPCLSQNLLPTRVALRSKKTIRNRSEAEAGKPGILVQPKTLPLEGDSSSKVQRGKWWSKDSSAVHEIPFIAISELPDRERLQDGSYSYMTVTFANPQSVDVCIRFGRDEQNRVPVSFALIDELGESSVVHTKGLLHTSSALHPPAASVADVGVLDLRLGPYEDELLKETSEEADPPPVMPGSPRARKAAPQLLVDAAPAWERSVSYNKGKVRIPVCFAKANDGAVINEYHADYLTCPIEVQLNCRMQIEGEADVPLMIKLVL